MTSLPMAPFSFPAEGGLLVAGEGSSDAASGGRDVPSASTSNHAAPNPIARATNTYAQGHQSSSFVQAPPPHQSKNARRRRRRREGGTPSFENGNSDGSNAFIPFSDSAVLSENVKNDCRAHFSLGGRDDLDSKCEGGVDEDWRGSPTAAGRGRACTVSPIPEPIESLEQVLPCLDGVLSQIAELTIRDGSATADLESTLNSIVSSRIAEVISSPRISQLSTLTEYDNHVEEREGGNDFAGDAGGTTERQDGEMEMDVDQPLQASDEGGEEGVNWGNGGEDIGSPNNNEEIVYADVAREGYDEMEGDNPLWAERGDIEMNEEHSSASFGNDQIRVGRGDVEMELEGGTVELSNNFSPQRVASMFNTFRFRSEVSEKAKRERDIVGPLIIEGIRKGVCGNQIAQGILEALPPSPKHQSNPLPTSTPTSQSSTPPFLLPEDIPPLFCPQLLEMIRLGVKEVTVQPVGRTSPKTENDASGQIGGTIGVVTQLAAYFGIEVNILSPIILRKTAKYSRQDVANGHQHDGNPFEESTELHLLFRNVARHPNTPTWVVFFDADRAPYNPEVAKPLFDALKALNDLLLVLSLDTCIANNLLEVIAANKKCIDIKSATSKVSSRRQVGKSTDRSDIGEYEQGQIDEIRDWLLPSKSSPATQFIRDAINSGMIPESFDELRPIIREAIERGQEVGRLDENLSKFMKKYKAALEKIDNAVSSEVQDVAQAKAAASLIELAKSFSSPPPSSAEGDRVTLFHRWSPNSSPDVFENTNIPLHQLVTNIATALFLGLPLDAMEIVCDADKSRDHFNPVIAGTVMGIAGGKNHAVAMTSTNRLGCGIKHNSSVRLIDELCRQTDTIFECSECRGQNKSELGDKEAWRRDELKAADDARNLTVSSMMEAAELPLCLKRLKTIIEQITSTFFSYCIAEMDGVYVMVPVEFGRKKKLIRAIDAASDAESIKQLIAAEQETMAKSATQCAEIMRKFDEEAAEREVKRRKQEEEAALLLAKAAKDGLMRPPVLYDGITVLEPPENGEKNYSKPEIRKLHVKHHKTLSSVSELCRAVESSGYGPSYSTAKRSFPGKGKFFSQEEVEALLDGCGEVGTVTWLERVKEIAESPKGPNEIRIYEWFDYSPVLRRGKSRAKRARQ